MPMNEQPPWGKKKKPASPEDFLAELIKKISAFFDDDKKNDQGEPDQEKQKKDNGAGLSKVVLVILAIVVIKGIMSSWYTIETGEVGVVLRFGEYNRTTNPGLNFMIPYIEKLERVNVEKVRKEEFGLKAKTLGKNSALSNSGSNIESLMLTGDKNVIECAWIVQYKVSDPFNFLFKVRNVPQAVRDASEMVTRRIVGNMDFDYILGNRDTLAISAKDELQEQLNKLETGVDIITLRFLDINPPDKVKPAFNEVNEADQDMKRLVNEAEETYNRVIPKAKGSAKQIIEEAHGYAVARVNQAKGETNRFLAIVKEYQQYPKVTKQRMYLEAMQDILPGVEHIFVMDRNQQNLLPFLDLSKKQNSNPTQSNKTTQE